MEERKKGIRYIPLTLANLPMSISTQSSSSGKFDFLNFRFFKLETSSLRLYELGIKADCDRKDCDDWIGPDLTGSGRIGPDRTGI
jgi:hypothetical protein